jgi:NAD(P)-dependent dehydrogenase (short-subunit alcohol dehydrogenase family)
MVINVNAICPGFYRTNLEGGSDDPDFVQSVREFVPMGKMAELEDIKGTTIYLASEASDRQVPRKPRLVGGVKGHNQK